MSVTPEQKRKFIEMVAPFAQNEYKKGKKIFPSVCIAQACCESAYGTTEKMKNANALTSVEAMSAKDYRAKIAAVNGIVDYTGTDEQNNNLLFLLKAGSLVKP